jgi:hypothetical protein
MMNYRMRGSNVIEYKKARYLLKSNLEFRLLMNGVAGILMKRMILRKEHQSRKEIRYIQI